MCRNILDLSWSGLSPPKFRVRPIKGTSFINLVLEEISFTLSFSRYFEIVSERKWEQRGKRVRENRSLKIQGLEES